MNVVEKRAWIEVLILGVMAERIAGMLLLTNRSKWRKIR